MATTKTYIDEAKNVPDKFEAWVKKRALRKSKGLALYDAGEVIGLVAGSLVNLTLLTKAVRAAGQENWGKAQFYGIMWAGVANNMGNTHSHAQRKRAHRLPGN